MFPWFSSPVLRYRALLMGSMVLLCATIVITAWTALVPFFLGLLLAYLLLPAVNFLDLHFPRVLRRKHVSRPLSILIVYVLASGVIAGILSYFIPAVSTQAKILGSAAPRLLSQLQGLITIDVVDFIGRIPPEIATWVEANLAKASETLTSAIQTGLTFTIRTVTQTVSFILGMVIVPFWLFSVLNDHAQAMRSFYDLVPEKARDDVRNILAIVDGLLSAYVRGQLLLCLVVGGMSTIALLALGVDLALLLGTFAGLFEVIPILGPYIGAIPAVLLALITRPILGLWVALAFFAIQQIENIFLVPRISGNAVRFHPAVVMVIVVVGAQVAGLYGLLVAVPVTAIIRDVYQYLYLRTTDRGATPPMALEALRARIS